MGSTAAVPTPGPEPYGAPAVFTYPGLHAVLAQGSGAVKLRWLCSVPTRHFHDVLPPGIHRFYDGHRHYSVSDAPGLASNLVMTSPALRSKVPRPKHEETGADRTNTGVVNRMCEIVPSSPVKSACLCGNRCGNICEYRLIWASFSFNIVSVCTPTLSARTVSLIQIQYAPASPVPALNQLQNNFLVKSCIVYRRLFQSTTNLGTFLGMPHEQPVD